MTRKAIILIVASIFILSASKWIPVNVLASPPDDFTVFMPLAIKGFANANRAMVFLSDMGGNFDLYTIHADGSEIIRLTNSPVEENEPDWSPDGKKITFYDLTDNGYAIYSMNADGSGIVQLTADNQSASYPDWSPDGSKIVFTLSQERGELYTMNADGSNQVQIPNGISGEYDPVWSPDGTKITFLQIWFINWKIDGYALCVMNSDGSEVTRLLEVVDGAHISDPDWSPDSSQIVFSSNYEDREFGRHSIYTLDARGTILNRLTYGFNAEAPAWSPDGRQIAFDSDRDGNSEIYVMDADGANIRRVTYNQANNFFPTWYPVTSP